jgi:hypothetical protein
MSLKQIVKKQNKNIRDSYRGINEFKQDYQPTTNITKDENGKVLNVHGFHDVRQMDIHTAEPLVAEPSLVEVETVIRKLKRYESPGTDQIPAELIETGGETCSEIHKLIRSIWNKEELPQQWKESIIVPIHKKGDKTDCNN